MPKYDFILFDADRTLFDYDKAEYEALKAVMQANGVDFSDELLKAYRVINRSLWDDFEKGLATRRHVQVARFEKLFERFNIKRDAVQTAEDFMSQLSLGSYLLDGAEAVCKKLSEQCRLYIVTNGSHNTQKARISNSAVSGYIADVFVSEGTGSQKPHIQYFNYVFERIKGFDKSRAVIVGDSLEADIKGGNNAGIDTCWYNPTREKNTTNAVCNYEINALEQLYEIIA